MWSSSCIRLENVALPDMLMRGVNRDTRIRQTLRPTLARMIDEETQRPLRRAFACVIRADR